MKLKHIAPLLLLALPLNAGIGTNETVTLTWDYPAADLSPDLTFRIRHSTEADLPFAKWSVLTNVAGTNLSVTLNLEPGQHYFYLTATNWWGESDPSNIASTPPRPRSGALRIHRGTPLK